MRSPRTSRAAQPQTCAWLASRAPLVAAPLAWWPDHGGSLRLALVHAIRHANRLPQRPPS